jgi:hypothetical protein
MLTGRLDKPLFCARTDWTTGVRFPAVAFFFSFAPRPDRLWGQLSLISSGYRGLFPPGESGRGVKSTHLHLLPSTSAHLYVFMAWCLSKQ